MSVMRPVFSVSALTWFIRTSAAVLLIAEGVISASIQCIGRMTPSATNSRAAEVLINHASTETLNTGRMTPSATNSTAAEGCYSFSIQCFSTDMVY
jgi:hypothetical protein